MILGNKTIITKSEIETMALAGKYAGKFKGGEVIGLVGELGAGKTVFTKGIARKLGVGQMVTSPTFVLMKIYKTAIPGSRIKNLCHIDAYRARGAEDIAGIGAEEYFNREDTVTVIEWADRIKKILPKKTRYVKFRYIKQQREINL